MTSSSRHTSEVVHCAITRVARQGKEQEFEAAILRFIGRSMSHDGTLGAHLLRPTAGSRPREYGILRSFYSEQDMEDFYASDLFKQWEDEVKDLMEGEPVARRLHGFEAFFHSKHRQSPPRWKMALLTWIGVFPTVLIWTRVLTPQLNFAHPIVISAIVSGISVVTLAWGVMPILTKCCKSWLDR
jgi:uncharacterized protein